MPEFLTDPVSIVAEAKQIRITHNPGGEVIAEGPLGWGITSFEGNHPELHVEIYESKTSNL